jgi:hypothetical protein
MKIERFNENYTIVMYIFILYSPSYGGHCSTFHYGTQSTFLSWLG